MNPAASRRLSPDTPRLLARLSGSFWAIFALFITVGLLIYAPSLHGDLIWDDAYLIGENPFYKSPVFAVEVFRHWLFFDSFSTYYRPVQNLSYIFDYWLWAQNPFGFHLTNVLLHSGSGVLLYFLLKRLFGALLEGENASSLERLLPLIVALLWTVHPVHNAAVAYISGRADSLASFFSLGAWLLVARLIECKGRSQRLLYGVAAAVAMLLALCSKEIALVWLALFVAHLLFFARNVSRRLKAGLVVGALAVFGIYLWLHALPPGRTPIDNGPADPFAARFLLMLRALGDYSSLIFWPAKLMMDRSISSEIMYQSTANWQALLRYEYLSAGGALVLAVFAWLAFRSGPGQRVRIFGVLWFIAAFLPISNLFPLNAQVAEHWIYLASIGYLTFVAGCLLLFPARYQRAAVVVIACAAVALGARTFVRSTDWADAETFYVRTIEAGGGTPRVRSNLANVYAQRGEFAKQEALLRDTLKHFPTFVPARLALGASLAKQGRSNEGAALLDLGKQGASLSQKFPRTWSAALSLASLRAREQKLEEALAILAQARERFPETWPLVKYEAELLQQFRGAAAAIPAVEEYAAKRWWHQGAWLTLGQLRFDAHDADRAIEAMRHAARLDIHDARPFANIARIELIRHRLEPARAAQQTAISRDRSQPSRYLVLADILEKLGRPTEAAAALREAEALRDSVRRDGA